MSRANLLPSGVGLIQSRDNFGIASGGFIGSMVQSGMIHSGGDTSRALETGLLSSADKAIIEKLDSALKMQPNDYNNEVEEIFANAVHTSNSMTMRKPRENDNSFEIGS